MENIAISKDGIEVSYLRYLSDSAAGFIVILIATASYFYPIFGFTLQEYFKIYIPVSSEMKIFIFLLLFLLSTPMGLIINATSWLLLGSLQIFIISFCVDEKYFTKSIKKVHKFYCCGINNTSKYCRITNMSEFFSITKENFYCISSYFEHFLEIYYPNIINPIAYVKGLCRLLRNMAFLSIICIILSLIVAGFNIIIIYLFIIFIALILVSGATYFHYYTLVLLKTYILCLKSAAAKPENGNIEEITNCLLKNISNE